MTALAHGTSPAARKRRRVALAFLAPWLAGFAVFAVYPLVTTLWLSFTNSDMISPARFVGLRNYRYLFGQDPYIGQAVRNTLWLVAVMVPLVLKLRSSPWEDNATRGTTTPIRKYAAPTQSNARNGLPSSSWPLCSDAPYNPHDNAAPNASMIHDMKNPFRRPGPHATRG